MSYGHYGRGEAQRAQRHQPYDPYAESERYGGQVRHVSRDEPGRGGGGGGGSNSRSYGGSSAAQSRDVGYSGGRVATSGSGNYTTSYGSLPPATRPRESSGFPGIQESDVWRTSNVSTQQRSSRQTVNYSHSNEREVYRPTWGDQSGSGGGSNSNRHQQQNVSFNYKGSGGGGQMGISSSPQATQPVLMMVPQGSNNLMGLVANPFAVQRQAGMQMIVGSLPTNLNPNIFDQQHLMGNQQYGSSSGRGGSRQLNSSSQQRSSSGRGNDRGQSSYGTNSGRGMRVSSSFRGGRRSSPLSGGRRRSPNRGVLRNAVYRKPININPPANSIAKKRVSDRADLGGQRKKLKVETNADGTVKTGSTPATPASTPNSRIAGNQRRRERRRRDAEARAAAASGGKSNETPKKTPTSSPVKKVEKKDEKKENKDSPTAVTTEAEGKSEISKKPDVEVVVLDEETPATATGASAVAKVEFEEKKQRKSKYDDFPSELLVCKVCQKSMNDGASFESHLSGRAHTALVKIVEARFQKRAEMLMLESRLAEEEIGVELDRQRRAGKSGGNANKLNNHCKMCDATYTVNWGSHKISLGHRMLKEFLHPSCRYCDANFVHRMDWLNHLFSLAHLRRISEQRHAGKDTSIFESITQEELFTINLEINPEEKPVHFLTIRNLDWKVPTAGQIKDLLDENEEIPEGEIVIPEEHDENVVTGSEMVIATNGFCCKVCRIYLTQEKELDSHCMSKSHFGMYVSFLKKLVKLQEEQKAAAARKAEEAEKKANDDEVTVLDDEGITEVGEEVENEGVEEVEGENVEDVEMNGEGGEEEEGMEEESYLEGEEASYNESLDESHLLDESFPEGENEEEKIDEAAGNDQAESNEVSDQAESNTVSDEVESKKSVEEVEAKKMAEAKESEAKKLAEESEAKKLAVESEAKQLAAESEAKKLAEESEAKKLAAESEAKKLAEEAEAKKVAEEAEAKKLAEEAEAKKLAEEAEAKKLAEDTEAKKLAQESETKKATEEAETKKEIEVEKEAQVKRAADEAEQKKAAEEAEKKVAGNEKEVESSKAGAEKQNGEGNEVKSVPETDPVITKGQTPRGGGGVGRGGRGASPGRSRGFPGRGVATTPAGRGQAVAARGAVPPQQVATRTPRGRRPGGATRGRGR